MNSRTGISSLPIFAVLTLATAITGCISEHHWDDDEWVDEECVCNGHENPPEPPTCPNQPEPPAENCPDPADTIYLSRDAAVCSSIQFSCPESFDSFNDSCGCGCIEQPEPPSCPEQQDTTTTYLSQDAGVCAMLNINCPAGRDAFLSPCGCGCIGEATEPPPPACPDASDPSVTYVNTDPTICAAIEFECPQACSRFDSMCGCGCITE